MGLELTLLEPAPKDREVARWIQGASVEGLRELNRAIRGRGYMSGTECYIAGAIRIDILRRLPEGVRKNYPSELLAAGKARSVGLPWVIRDLIPLARKAAKLHYDARRAKSQGKAELAAALHEATSVLDALTAHVSDLAAAAAIGRSILLE